ncbi:MAG: glycerol-3-phosphate 1-O-acyltransferase PlsY [Faecalimonas sp.]|nr:glycerol-3-phosphate 1-O-acyltransferase PlsY [Faecalimonas sp.]
MERLICVAIGYLFGLFQTGYIYGMINHVDIRKHGSGNAGTTNALRTLGWKAGVITFIGDCLKCVLAVVLVRFIFADSSHVELLAIYAGLGAVLGHNFPFYLNFKGGKGIASTAGLILAVNPVMFLIVAIVFIAIVWFTQYVSLGSIVIMVLFVIQVVIYGQMGGFGLTDGELYEFYAIAIVLAALAIWRHRANIKRLATGTENKTDLRKIGKKS